MTRTATRIRIADNLEWLRTTGPDHIAAIATEQAELDRQTRPRTPTSDTTDRGYRTGHADPTTTTAFTTTTPTPKTITDLDRNLHAIHNQARHLNHTTAQALGNTPTEITYEPDRYGLISNALTYLPPAFQLEHAATQLAGTELTHLDWTLRDLDERTLIVTTRAATILEHSPRAAAQPATQQTIAPCTHCSRWRTGTIAIQAGHCPQCRDFEKHHKCLPTEAIVRRWDYGKSATPSQILEAKATPRPKLKRAS